MNQNTPETVLLDEVRKGNQAAVTEIHRRYEKKVYLMAYGITKNKEESEDITQEVFADFWKDRLSIKVKTSLRNYLITMARNKSVGVLRSRTANENHISRYLYIQTKLEVTIHQFDHQFYKKRIQIILENKCASINRDAYKYHEEYNMPYREVADKLGTTVSNARAYVSKAKRVLKRFLKKYR